MNFRVVIVLLLAVFLPVVVFADTKEINLKAGSSRVVKYSGIKSAEVSSKDTARATVLSDKEVIIEAVKEGSTVVTINTDRGRENILVKIKKAVMAEKMIEVDVQILEITYADSAGYGIDWPALLKGSAGEAVLPLVPLNAVEQAVPDFQAFGLLFRRGPINAFVKLLVEKNNAKILAKPKLLSANGKSAQFLSGGEIPVSLVDSDGKVTVDWKKYGVSLDITPEITKNNTIMTAVKAQVSTLDYVNGVKFTGNDTVLPALKSRSASTTVTAEHEDTIVIAGLIENSESKIYEGVPLLMDIPLIGELFKSSTIRSSSTELVIFVTPRIAGESGV